MPLSRRLRARPRRIHQICRDPLLGISGSRNLIGNSTGLMGASTQLPQRDKVGPNDRYALNAPSQIYDLSLSNAFGSLILDRPITSTTISTPGRLVGINNVTMHTSSTTHQRVQVVGGLRYVRHAEICSLLLPHVAVSEIASDHGGN